MRRLLRGSVGFWLVIMPALFLVAVPGTVLAQVSDALRTKAASEAASLLTRAEQGEVRVIVTLRGATSGSTGSSSSSSTAQPSAAMTAGPLGDGQPATVEQSALIATHILAFEGDSHVEWFEGNFEAYEEDKKRRLGADAAEPHRIKYKAFTR